MVGRDTARFVLLRARPDSMPVLDVDVLSTSTDANPAFRVRHTHARLCAVARHAEALDVRPGGTVTLGATERVSEPAHRRELDLLASLAGYERLSGRNEQYLLARYLESLAQACTRFEASCPALPLGDEPVTDVHRARVALCAQARRVLADGLRRLDVSAPEQM